LLLSNTTKDALNLRGRGEWADRADIIYEVRDATDFIPSGKKPWWQELPEAGESAWADRAARRKGRIDFRLAFVCSKFRLGPEPEPFCIELYLPETEPWTLRDVTNEIVQAGEGVLEQTKQQKAACLTKAAEMLAKVVSEREQQNNPILTTEAENYLREVCNLKRNEARKLLDKTPLWRLENQRQGKGKQAAWYLLPKNDGNGDEFSSPLRSLVSDTPIVAVRTDPEQQRQCTLQPLSDKLTSDADSLPNGGGKRKEGATTETKTPVFYSYEDEV
jgi:hypothetical protein